MLFEECAEYARRAGSDWGLAVAAGLLAAVVLERREFEQALQLSIDAAALADDVGDSIWQGVLLSNAATAALRLGRVELAADLLRTTIRTQAEMSSKTGILRSIPARSSNRSRHGQGPNGQPASSQASQQIADETGHRLEHHSDAETNPTRHSNTYEPALGNQADTALTAGRAMTLDDAVTDALDSIPS